MCQLLEQDSLLSVLGYTLAVTRAHSITYKTTKSGSPVAFWTRAAWRCDEKTAAFTRLFAQLNVSMNKSSVEGAILAVDPE